MRTRQKGNRLEQGAAGELLACDAPDPVYGRLASSTGRVGHLDLGADIITRRFAAECKNREDITDRLWSWLDHVSVPDKVKLLIVKRNRREPLVVLTLDDFCDLVSGAK